MSVGIEWPEVSNIGPSMWFFYEKIIISAPISHIPDDYPISHIPNILPFISHIPDLFDPQYPISQMCVTPPLTS